ncbi:glycosyltransferase [Flavobacterium sp. NST-5]|uniref:Glycosyltransferase n=1 Tax=Flavobacterium ichthyis TaxID=2698827 RepID=A0ABW9Z8D8_9FLAO|nr:glycosyltransferase family 4 protein [Flavobacterium ichthyis]NBL64837.1 glycosyltransferase [Flavobacterium ichthyis]
MPKVILLSQFPLPYSKIGSWTTLYKNYLQNAHSIDYIVCSPPEIKFQGVDYALVKNDFSTKLGQKFFKKKYTDYFNALEEVVQPNEKYILQVIDNYGIVPHLEKWLQRKKLRQQFYIQFFYHGFPPFFGNFAGREFFNFIDEMVLLTYDSYKAHRDYYTILPAKFSVLHNGIDTQKFFKVTEIQKQQLKAKFKVSNKTIFVWCSQDRPKKGLDLILDVWNRIYSEEKNMELWVIGATRNQTIKGVKFLGRIENDLLPEYFQASDCYLFPTLNHEGFGLSLIEALHCGNYCIASAMGGVPEVLQYGKLGKLIENPHFILEWVKAMEDFLQQPKPEITIPDGFYSKESWNEGMNAIIASAKKSMEI